MYEDHNRKRIRTCLPGLPALRAGARPDGIRADPEAMEEFRERRIARSTTLADLSRSR